jgi:hypothetical protein
MTPTELRDAFEAFKKLSPEEQRQAARGKQGGEQDEPSEDYSTEE